MGGAAAGPADTGPTAVERGASPGRAAARPPAGEFIAADSPGCTKISAGALSAARRPRDAEGVATADTIGVGDGFAALLGEVDETEAVSWAAEGEPVTRASHASAQAT